MADAAIGIAGGGDDAETAEDVLAPEALVEDVHVGHAVEEGQDGGLGADGRGEGGDGVFEVVGFAAEEDEVEGLVEVLGEDCCGGRQG